MQSAKTKLSGIGRSICRIRKPLSHPFSARSGTKDILEPGYTWQSSSGTDTFEPKFSLVPLIFGTIKAAFYSLLFAIPIALCAAIYTSEFVAPRVRNIIKPTMEMMASLPSVVLGFIAALILAPIVESWIAAIVLAFVVMPLSFFLERICGSSYPKISR